MEKQIISAILSSRSAFETFERVGGIHELSPIASACARATSEYYLTDPDARSIDRAFIESRMLRDVKNDKHVSTIRDYLRTLPDASAPNIERELNELHRQRIDGKLSLALANGSPEEEVQKLIDARRSIGSGNSSKTDAGSLLDVLNVDDLTTEKDSGIEYIKLWPKALNDRLDGGALRGHHGLVFARPETGKTLFAINLCAGFLHQQLSVLYVGNEEPAADIRDRIRGRLLKTSKQSIRSERSESARRLSQVQLGALSILESTTFADVRACLERAPGLPADDRYTVVILDQVRNMRLKSDSRTAELEAAGIEARAIAKEYGVLVVSITQAGDSATNKVFLSMSDVDSSKTGIPASVDLMIGIGADEAMKVNGLLGISLPKNKLSGLHDHFTVSCNFSTGEIK